MNEMCWRHLIIIIYDRKDKLEMRIKGDIQELSLSDTIFKFIMI